MRKFIVGIIVSVVLVTAGAFTLFFEFSDYEIVEDSDYDSHNLDNMKSYEFTNVDEYIVINSDDDIRVEWQYDDSFGDEVKVYVNSFMDTRRENNTIDIREDSISFKGFIKSGEYLLDGLKNKEIRVYDHDDMNWGSIVIKCSSSMRSKVIIND